MSLLWKDHLTRRPLSEPLSEPDAAFLRSLYAETRAAELALLPWTDAQKAAFTHQQFTAQHTFYHAQYPHASYDLLLFDSLLAGRLYVDRRPSEIALLDITLLPEHRGWGLGTLLLQELIAESEAVQMPLRLHVEAHNPAFRLYHRLGFVPVSDNGIYFLMERLPSPPP